MRLGFATSTNGLGLRCAVARNSQTIIANLPKYAVHGRGATKPPAPVSRRTYVPYCGTELETNACSLSCHCTVLSLCVAIAVSVPFEGVATFDSYQACA